jgi:hypothetical protein
VDDAPEGFGERVDSFIASAGPLYIRVQERHYFTESPRPPREKTNAAYKLTVSATRGPGHLEEEPNDTLEQPSRLTTDRAVTAFTGFPVPYEPAYLSVTLSSADFFRATPDSVAEAAIIVPPAEGALLAVDSGAFQNWQRANNAQGDAFPPSPVTISGKTVLLPLRPPGRGIRLQPSPNTKPGSMYFVAAVSHLPDGMAGALQLVQVLRSLQRDSEAAQVLKLAKEAFPQSSQLADLERASR